MVTTHKRVRRTAFKLAISALAAASFGAVVMASPVLVPRNVVAKTDIGMLQPLAQGPAIQLAAAPSGEREDCVRVTHIKGPDGKDYPTFGMVCSGD